MPGGFPQKPVLVTGFFVGDWTVIVVPVAPGHARLRGVPADVGKDTWRHAVDTRLP